jgi:2-phospho-L-lactate guanylyltransferase
MSGWRGGWTAVVPVKALTVAKSRLDLPPARRAAFVLAMATDVVMAAEAADTIRRVLVVTDDPRVRTALETHATVVADTPGAGLSAALRHGAEVALSRWPRDGVVAIAADLPALTPAALDAVLSRCQPGRSLVADLGGTGTVLLAATPGTSLDPDYEGRSHDAHVAGGAVDLSAYAEEGLRRDVDTVADLAHTARLGAGNATRAVLAALDT